MRLFGGENLKSLMARIGMGDGEPIFHPLINKSIERAQKRVEDRNFEIRKHLLEYDDVLNEQRSFIYSQRDEILNDSDLKGRVYSTASDLVSDIFDEYLKSGQETQAGYAALAESLKTSFFYTLPVSRDELKDTTADAVRERIAQDIEEDLRQKALLIGEREFNNFIRFQYLKSIDSQWQDHLETTGGIAGSSLPENLRAEKPLLEYKIEGFDIFDSLIYEIKSNVAKNIIKIKIQHYHGDQQPKIRMRENTDHSVTGQFNTRHGEAGSQFRAEPGREDRKKDPGETNPVLRKR